MDTPARPLASVDATDAALGEPSAPERPRRAAVAAWVTYDLANTIFSLAVVSLHFPLWVIAAGGSDGLIGVATSASMLAVALAAPVLGAVSDAAPRRMPFLLACTVACVALTAALGRTPLLPALAVFAFANAFYNLGLVFYDSLLPEVSTPATRGRIGGLGVAVGYVGSFIGIAVGAVILARGGPEARPLVFLAAAGLFLRFALPCFLLVRERPRPRRARASVLAGLRATLADTARYPGLRRFLVGRVFFADAANTLIVFMGVYVTHEVGFDEQAVSGVLAAGIAGAILGGLVVGRVADRVGPKRALYGVMTLWLAVFAGAIAVPVLALPKALFWGVAALAGFALGGTWASDRPFMLRLTPPDRVGEFYGLYAMAGRFAAVLGPLLWALVVTGLGWGRPAAIGTLAAMMVLAMVLLRGVDDAPSVPTGRTST